MLLAVRTEAAPLHPSILLIANTPFVHRFSAILISSITSIENQYQCRASISQRLGLANESKRVLGLRHRN